MGKMVLIASGKGGVGKSTLAMGLGKALSRAGKKVLLIDSDAGLASLGIMLGASEKTVFNWNDVISGSCTMNDAIVSISDNLAFLPAPDYPLREIDTEALKSLTGFLSDGFDYVITDGPAGLGIELERVAVASDTVIVVATADEVSVNGAHALEKAVRQFGVSETMLVINRYDIKAVKKHKLLTIDDIINKSGVRLIGIVPEDKEIMYSSVTGNENTSGKTFSAFERIASRIDGKDVKLTISLLK